MSQRFQTVEAWLAVLAAACLAACGGGGTPAADGGTDAAARDAGPVDAGSPDASLPPVLSGTTLYSDFASRTVAPGSLEFQPVYPAWADGAAVRRWLQLPTGGQIDTRDMDHWVFPIGTRSFQELALGGVPVETRVIERTGPGSADYLMGAYVWNATHSEASYAEFGANDINGTEDDAPASVLCETCHNGEHGRLLGFSAIQLSKPGPGVTLTSLASAGTLSSPPPAGTEYPPPGDPATRAALGYLHGNCGHCHSSTGFAFGDTSQILRLAVAERTPETTQTYLTTVGVHLNEFAEPGYDFRIVAGSPATSAIVYRMGQRGDNRQMPPFATEHTDITGNTIVSTWISALP